MRKPLPLQKRLRQRPRERSVGEAPEHGEHPVARREGGRDGGGVDVAPRLRDAEAGDDLVGAAGGDALEVEAVATEAPAALAEVERHGGGGAPDRLRPPGLRPSC